MFSVILPHGLYIFQKIYLICYSFIYDEEGLHIRDFMYLYKLGEIDIAILADHGVINSGEMVID